MSASKEHGIAKLSDYEHARLRTEMYLGSRTPHTQDVLLFNDEGAYVKEMTWVPALFTAFRESFDNGLDEVIGHGHGNSIWVEFDEANMTISLEDNGRGIPFDFDKEHNTHIATMVLSETKTGRNFGERGEVAGTNGLGISIVNYCSEQFDVRIRRDNKQFTQTFNESVLYGTLVTNDAVIKEVKSSNTGTKISFKLSKTVFEHMVLPEEFIRARIIEVAYTNPKVSFYFNGQRIKAKTTIEKFLYGKKKPILVEVDKEDFKSKFFVVPNFLEKGDFTHSLVNRIPALNGGNHIDLFRRQFVGDLMNALKKLGKKRKLEPNRSDITEGLLFYNVTEMTAPNFDSQSKTRLINEKAGKYAQAAVNEDVIKKVIRQNPEWIEAIFERCAIRTNKIDANELANAEKKVAKKKIAKLIEANSKNRRECVLFVTEGDSAMNMSAVRDPNIHAGLPLRGKILNVHGEDPKKVITNQTISDLMSAIGLSISKKADRSELRYGKLYIAHDMDPDGYSIGALLVNFFHSYWPELFTDATDPFINVFMTPFIIAEKGKERRYWYGDDHENFKPEDYKGWSITRAKGLGSLEEQDWENALKTPKLFPIVDDGRIKESLDLIFNNNRSDDRKEWIGK